MTNIVEANSHSVNARLLRQAIIEWGRSNYRSFPWRATTDPYRILLSEIMLHRTRACQVVPVYEHFVEKYPDVNTLSEATREELHEILYCLGLHWRIDLIHTMAKELLVRFNAIVPHHEGDLLSLPGVSKYIAGAVRCFAWNMPETLADTNTVRVIGRLFGLIVKDSSRRNRQFLELLSSLVDRENPRHYYYALLDLANRICTKKQEPICEQCPLAKWCLYAHSNRQSLA